MTFVRRLSFLFIISTLIFTSCVEDKDYGEEANSLRPRTNENIAVNANLNQNANVAEDDEIRLKELVNIPYEVQQDSVWKEEKLLDEDGKETGVKKLTAVFRFSEEDSKTLVKKLAEGSRAIEANVDALSWFPEELIAKSETSGNNTLKGNKYPAESFLKPPFTTGSIVRIQETDYFVLVAQTQ